MDKKRKENEAQLLIATHSTFIIDELNHDDIILVRREKDVSRGFYSTITQLGEEFWDNDLTEFKYNQFFSFRNSDFFFSKYVIITESKTDSQVIKKLISEFLGWKISYVSLIELNGVTSLQYPYFLLKKLRIPFSVIVDKDFFVQYKDDALEKSREEETGFPIYKNVLNETVVINDFLCSKRDKDEVAEVINNGSYTSMFEKLRKFNFYSMNYCLEMDMVYAVNTRKEFYKILNLPPEKQSKRQIRLI